LVAQARLAGANGQDYALPPVALDKQVMILYAVINGFLDDIPVSEVSNFEADFTKHMATSHADVCQAIARRYYKGYVF
jgi:F0F1-type ATP synthase alpha subunit